MLSRQAFVFVLALFAPIFVHAEVEPVMTVGIEGGGDKLANTSTNNLSAGGGFAIGAGVNFSKQNSPVSIRLILHYLFDSTGFINPEGKGDFSTYPLELGIFKRTDKNEVGGGLTSHLNAVYEFCSEGVGCSKTDFGNPVGLYGQYNYYFLQGNPTGILAGAYASVYELSK